MSTPRKIKPTPKDAIAIDQQFINPYLANTNDGIVVEGHPLRNNRGQNFSFKDDKVKDIHIGLQDIDAAMMNYFNDVIKPTVVQDNNRMAVRTVYANPERWKSVQADGFYRDGNGQITVPIIMLKRDTVEKARGLGNKIDGNTIALYQVVGEAYNSRNAYDKFDVINNRIPSKQFYVTTVPDYLTLTYNCVIFTNFVEQNNKIVESFEFASDSYWGDADRFKFRASIDSFSTTTIIENGTDRVAKSTFNIKVNGYIIPDTISKDLATVRSKFYTKSQVIFTMETAGNIETLTTSGKAPKTAMGSAAGVADAYNVNVTYNGLPPDAGIYLNTNKQLTGTFVNNITITFASSWLAAPAVFPSTSVDNFTFFCNGQFIEKSAIVSFTQSGGISTLVINPILLSYDFELTDEIIAIGKFV
jgi:adenosylcobinamide amidohydrolase